MKPPRRAHLHEVRGEAAGEADPVQRRQDAVRRHQAEGERAQPLPLLAQGVRVELGEEHRQQHGEHRQQVHLAPVLRDRK